MGCRKNDIELGANLWFQKSDRRYLGGERIYLLEKIDELGSITKAARSVGISYKTAWDAVNAINNLSGKPLVERQTGGKGGGGARLTQEGKRIVDQFRVVQEEHRKYLVNLEERLGDISGLDKFLRRIAMKVSARNVFAGTVSKITKGAVNAEVSLTIGGGAIVVATVTNGAVDNLGLKEGMDAYAIIKASSVIIGTDLHDATVSARNIFCGTVSKIIEGPVSTEVDVEIGGGNTISAVITHESSTRLDLKTGGHACALFKASSVILGVS
ncbi:TOBE domain-containing protein [Geobacter sp. SVR]|uniref:TOBE domain-containing protein n=1 Tax=Geobacter sp. SVR TaxID=2495594 RepID=UPI00143EFABF|nr:TOBE domain-containing protein [Geobacter sp. SVR]BCS55285.1 ModE family transcriptional regulator [Geobacter sp. SVR]GCF86084.1 ModE family transcriptional regulator [Geobacter sp. SVR]